MHGRSKEYKRGEFAKFKEKQELSICFAFLLVIIIIISNTTTLGCALAGLVNTFVG